MCVAKNVAVLDLTSEIKVKVYIKDELSSEAASICKYIILFNLVVP